MIKLQRFIGKLSTGKSTSINKPVVDYNQRGQYRSPLQLKKGDKLNDFEVTQRQKLLDFQIDSVVLKCQKYNTQWVHFDCQQQKNSIGFAFKCKQAPHTIKLSMQKLLQCGSNKFPIRNPIQFMTRRSFNPQNFSYTTNEYMFYGYQTTLLHDHKNLMQVFMNMMFNPLLRQEDFQQIIWRYSLKDNNKLQIQGEAANQIKSNWHFSQMKIFDAIQRQMFGRQGISKPGSITNLKFQDILEWHKKIFDPKNLLIISHGDLHPAKLIQNYRKITQQFKWQQTYLNNRSQSKPLVKQQKYFQLQQSKTVKIQHLQPNVPLVLSFKLQNITSTQRILLSILSNILFDMPNSIFMNWNTPETPYPKLYGFQGNYFNIGITIQAANKKIEEKDFLGQQKKIRQSLQKLVSKKIPNTQIQQCLYHLQDQYYSKDGIKIITGCLDNLCELGTNSLQQSLNVKFLISRILRIYQKDNIFEQLIKKYILNNQKYIRIWGKNNQQLVEDTQFQQKIRLRLNLQNMTQSQLQQIRNYKPGDLLQDYRILPKIDINQYQIFQQKNPTIFQINNIPIFHSHKCDGIKLTIKYDITDIDEDDIKLIPVICEAFPWMGGKGINVQAFRTHIDMYIKKIQMKFQTNRTNQGMRLYLFLNIQFSERNAEFGFNLCSNLINDHNHNNVQMLSQRIQKKASQAYNDLTQKLIEFHGQHIGGTRSPYAMIEDPLFMSRSICSLASDILKIANPKQFLNQISFQLKKITTKLTQKNRMSILFECKNKNLDKYKRYLQMMLNPLKQTAIKMDAINDKQFTPAPCLKYFPNYQEQFIFQAFSVPYYNNIQQVPSTLVLSSIINQNIKRLNQSGGSFLFKGSIVSYIRGSRKKVLQLQQYYKKIQDINQAKRFIFQQFRRYTSADLFYTGVTAEEARIFKQAVALTDQASIESCLQKYVLKDIKQGKSSILALGTHLGSYEPLIKKGWTIQRSIEDMSLRMESESTALPQLQMSKYINIY